MLGCVGPLCRLVWGCGLMNTPGIGVVASDSVEERCGEAVGGAAGATVACGGVVRFMSSLSRFSSEEERRATFPGPAPLRPSAPA